MPVAPPSRTPPGDDAPPDRSRRLVVVVGILGALSAVIAGLVIFSSGGATPPKEPQAQVRASGQSLIVGRPGAPTKVIVYDDFGDPASRDFEIASRDFLRIEAAQGHVLVTYQPFRLTEGYSTQALEAWAAVVQRGTARQAMRFRDLLFDRQPDATGTSATPDQLEAWAVDAGVRKGIVSDGLSNPDSAFVESTQAAAHAGGVKTAPTILVDGGRLGAGSGIALADELQRRLLKG
jgi:protein-disulfide isomerase